MTDYQGNSRKQREEETKQSERPKIERITTSDVKIRKKGPWRTFKGLIIEADMNSVGRYLWFDWIVPAVKNTVVDVVEQGIKRAVYGDRRAAYRSGPGLPSQVLGQVSRYSYNQPVVRNYMPDPASVGSMQISSQPQPTAKRDSRGYVISSRQEAIDVLELMNNIVGSQWGQVSVADLHTMLGLPIDDFMLNAWGWTDLRTAQIRQERDGWILELPEAIPIQQL